MNTCQWMTRFGPNRGLKCGCRTKFLSMEQKFSRYCSRHHNKGNEQDKERVQYFSEKYDKDPEAFYEEKRKENEKQDNEFQIRVIQLFAKDLITERFENEN